MQNLLQQKLVPLSWVKARRRQPEEGDSRSRVPSPKGPGIQIVHWGELLMGGRNINLPPLHKQERSGSPNQVSTNLLGEGSLALSGIIPVLNLAKSSL